MAIISEVPGLTVTLEVAGQDLAEYDDGDEEKEAPDTTTKYVEAQSGANFGFVCRFDAAAFPYRNDHVETELYMDGQYICGMMYDPTRIANGARDSCTRLSETRGDKKYTQYFTFAELNINEGPADKGLKGKLDDLGTISVRCIRFKYGAARRKAKVNPAFKKVGRGKKATPAQPPSPPPPAPAPLERSILKDDQVPEKNLKGRAISHQAKLGAPIEEPARRKTDNVTDTRPIIIIDDEPFATFNFKYRSRTALQSLQIIPRSPSPVPLEDRPIEELTAEEMRELLTRQKEQKSKDAELLEIKKEIKRERGEIESGDSDDDDFQVLEHPKKKARTQTPGADDEIVNLSDDD